MGSGCNIVGAFSSGGGGGGATVEIDSASLTSNFSTTASSPTVVTGVQITIADITDGSVIINCVLECNRNSTGGIQSELEDDSTYIAGTGRAAEVTNTSQYWNMSMNHVMAADGSVVRAMVWSNGTTLVRGGTGSEAPTSNIISLGVG